MRGFTITVLALMTGLFCSSVLFLPMIGNTDSAPQTHITPVYISQSQIDTGSPNIVTATLADYRGFDTMWETTVMYLSGLTAVLILSKSMMGRRPEKEDDYE